MVGLKRESIKIEQYMAVCMCEVQAMPFGWRGDDCWALPQAAQYKIWTRFGQQSNVGLTSMFLRSHKTWSYLLGAYSHIDIALYSP